MATATGGTGTSGSSATGGGKRPSIDVVGAIAAKRDGHPLTQDQIDALIQGYVGGRIPDYQMSALLMAILFKGLGSDETLWLTESMVRSGTTLDMSSLGRRIVDKHSTGGVGDKVSIALAPIVAACGVPFGKMSGRGLGHTGGTLDKLESIPGFKVELSQDQFLKQVAGLGICIAGQTADIVPADKKLYALRDVTATVESMPLIAASIMSKKLACGADAIVLDVKVGSGAFMKTLEDARILSATMREIGEGAGRQVKVLITDMSTPLGHAVGNALEILEVIEILEGGGPADLKELVLTGAALLLSVSDLGISEEEGRVRAQAAIDDGSARELFDRWVVAQGGNPKAPLEVAPVEHTVLAPEGGIVTQLDALEVGLAASRLGAGRQKKGDSVDHAVGIQLHASLGERVAAGDPVFTVHARTEEAAHEAATAVENATRIEASAHGKGGARKVIIERHG